MSDPIKGIESTTSDEQLNIRYMVEHAARAHGDQEVITDMPGGAHRYTYSEMYDRINQAAHALQELGVSAGDAIGIYGYSTYRNVELIYAAGGLGATAFLVNLELPESHKRFCVDHVQEHAPFEYMFTDGGHLEELQDTLENPDRLEYVVTRELDDYGDLDVEPVGTYESMLAGHDTAFDWPRIDEDTAVILGFTSGTTGKPKAMTHSHRALWLHDVGYHSGAQLDPQDSVLMVPPLFHYGWEMWGFAPLAGSKLVMPGPEYPDNLLDLLFDHDITFSSGVATLFRKAAERAKKRQRKGVEVDFSGLHVVFAGQSPPRDLMRDLEELGAETSQAYGYSESAGGPHFAFNVHGDLRDRELEMDEEERFEYKAEVGGYPPAGVHIRVLDVEDGTEQPWDGESPGEIAISAPWCVNGYWKMPDRTAENRDGRFLKMGDFVTVDNDANIRVRDRVKDAIKSGGEWIPSPTIEELINEHPQVASSCVIAADHPEWGERPIAVVELAERVDPDEVTFDLEEFLEPHVADGTIQKWWIPDRVVVDEIPITGTGKFNKKTLRDQYGDILTEG